MKLDHKSIGKLGEKIATSYLIKKGFKIIDRHFTSHWGEIDIIAKKEDKISFLEVKTRIGDKMGKPYEAVTFYKIKALKRAIDYYLLKNNLKNYKLSLDLISIILNNDLSLKKIDYYENVEI